MKRRTFSKAISLGLAVGVASAASAALAACSKEQPKSGPVTITVQGLPPETNAAARKVFLDDVAAFQTANPDVKVDAHEGTMDAQTFPARLAGGQLEDVFNVYFTTPADLIARKQAADLTPYIKDFPAFQQLRPDLLKIFSSADGHVYGVPTEQYTLGLSTTASCSSRRASTRTAHRPHGRTCVPRPRRSLPWATGLSATATTARATRVAGTSRPRCTRRGGDVAVQDGGKWKAAFNNATGKALLQDLYNMRWVDNSMGEKQLLEWADLVQMMASGKLGMNVGAPDSISAMAANFNGKPSEYGLAPIPGGKATLAGGAGYMINAKATPEKIKAGLKWLTFRFANPDRIEAGFKAAADAKQVVGLPSPTCGAPATPRPRPTRRVKQYANVPGDNYTKFVANPVPLKVEPPKAQELYAILDNAMAKVLTDKNANIDALLSDAEKQINTILASVQ
jgi:ABC-type glycerol-3-phosphate transport system substrate-binding protein